MSTTTLKRTRGSCLCGEFQFETEGDPFTYYVCHCANCRKSTGSAFMTNAFFKPELVHITKGEDKVKEYSDTATTSGRALTRTFCPGCGSCLFVFPENKQVTIVPVGLLDDPVEWVPRSETRVDARFAWIKELHIAPKAKPTL